MELSGNTAIVTGGGSGIGRATALKFANYDVNVVVADIDTETGESTATEIESETDANAVSVEVDVTDGEQVAEMISIAVDEFGEINYGFNNAGIDSDQSTTAEIPESAWTDIINVNLTGVWQCMRHEIRQMLDQPSEAVIVNTSSILGKVGFETAPAYTAAKHGVLGLTKTAALEYSTDEIRINAICPGFIETPMLQETRDLEDEANREETAEKHPMNRLGQPEEVADAVLWLCSDGASFTTGEVVAVDGGYLSQ